MRIARRSALLKRYHEVQEKREEASKAATRAIKKALMSESIKRPDMTILPRQREDILLRQNDMRSDGKDEVGGE